MSSKYKVRDKEGLYFITFTVVGWVDLFIRNIYRDCIITSFDYCIKHKGLKLHAFVIMTSHIHAIVSSEKDTNLADIIRDYKKYTSLKLIEHIKTTGESRREWMLNKFQFEAHRTQRGKNYLLWQEGYHAKQIETVSFLEEKLNYIHENPVAGGFVSRPQDYQYSSARNYYGEMGVIEVEML